MSKSGALWALAIENSKRTHGATCKKSMQAEPKEEIDKLVEMLKIQVRADMAEKFLAEIREK